MATKSQKRRERNRERKAAALAEAMRPRTEEEMRLLEEKMARSWHEKFSYRSRGHPDPLTFHFSGIPVPYDEDDPSKDLVEKTEDVRSVMSHSKH